MKPSELFCFKDTKNLAALLFFVAACNKKFQRANATDIAEDGNDSLYDGMSTGLRNTRTARGFSDPYHVFARKQCILCPAVRHGCRTFLCYIDSRFFQPLEQSRTALLGCRLTGSTVRWQLTPLFISEVDVFPAGRVIANEATELRSEFDSAAEL